MNQRNDHIQISILITTSTCKCKKLANTPAFYGSLRLGPPPSVPGRRGPCCTHFLHGGWIRSLRDLDPNPRCNTWSHAGRHRGLEIITEGNYNDPSIMSLLCSPLDATSGPFCFCDQCRTQWVLKGFENLKKRKKMIAGDGFKKKPNNWLLTCADVHWICTYRCWDGGQLWGVGCFQLDEGSERAPDEAESPLSVPPPPPVDLQDGSDHSWMLGCPAGPSQSGEGEVKQLEENYTKQMLLEGKYYFHSQVQGCNF